MSSVENLITEEQIGPEKAAKLEQLQPGTCCEHKSWGYGVVKELDVLEGTITIDFEKKPQHKLDVLFALDSLQILPNEHIFCRRKNEPEKLQQLATEQPLELLRIVVDSLGRRATADIIQSILTPFPIPTESWRKWWENVRKLARTDGRFTFPNSKTSPITYADNKKTPTEILKAANQFKHIDHALDLLNELLKNHSEIIKNKQEALTLLQKVEELLSQLPSSTKARQDILRLALARDELAEKLAVEPKPHVQTSELIKSLETQIPQVIHTLPSDQQRRMLKMIQQQFPSTWQNWLISFLRNASSRLLTSLREHMASQDLVADFDRALLHAVRELSVSSETLIWIIKNRKYASKQLINPQLFVALLAAIERDQIGENRSNRLRDLVISDKHLITDLLQDADVSDIRDIARQLILSSVFNDMDKRSLLARIIKKFPEVESFISTTLHKTKETQTEKYSDNSLTASEGKLIVSWKSLQRRKAELDELINKKIPANVKEIAIARSYGDLRENAEYKFAKEQQALLARRRAELEADLLRAEGTDFSNPDTSCCSIGTTITLSAADGTYTYSILGAWDTDPKRNYLSYLTPAARAILGKRVGETVEFPREDGTSILMKIEKIEPFTGELPD